VTDAVTLIPGEAVDFTRSYKGAITEDEQLPRWMRLFLAFLQHAPMTELKTFTGLVLLVLTAAWLALAASFGNYIKIDAGLLNTWLLFLSGLLTITAFGQGWKQSVAGKVSVATAAKESSP
jgi:hypothetical protein